ncbi:UNVERIFIED_CONTAM: hypothetical protein GTU68_018625 [Idotea baltica]|nr:hypothetical protein [Idotea baltica]
MEGQNILIQRRALSKYHTPGLWANTCCTHPDWHEKPKDCAVRRLDEELGIKGLCPTFRGQIEYRADVGNDLIEHEVVDVFVADADKSLHLDLNPDEVDQAAWMDFRDLKAEVKHKPEKYTPWLQIYLEKYHETIFGSLAFA